MRCQGSISQLSVCIHHRSKPYKMCIECGNKATHQIRFYLNLGDHISTAISRYYCQQHIIQYQDNFIKTQDLGVKLSIPEWDFKQTGVVRLNGIVSEKTS
jgi:hypothetical protein